MKERMQQVEPNNLNACVYFSPQDQLDPGKPMDLSTHKATARQSQEVDYLSYQYYLVAKEIPRGFPEAQVAELQALGFPGKTTE